MQFITAEINVCDWLVYVHGFSIFLFPQKWTILNVIMDLKKILLNKTVTVCKWNFRGIDAPFPLINMGRHLCISAVNAWTDVRADGQTAGQIILPQHLVYKVMSSI